MKGWASLSAKENAMSFVAELWKDGWVGRTLFVSMLALLSLIAFGIYETAQSEKRWEAFKVAHDCKVVGHISGSTQTGVGFGMVANGQMGTLVTTITTPAKVGWLCADGITYWR